nr:hypothetical protein [Tanacetum cinerariifolium]
MIWIPDVESNFKPSKGHIFVSLNQAYDFYKHYGKLGGFDIKLSIEKNYHATEVPDINVANGKGKGKVTSDGFSRKGKTIDVSNVSNPDDGFSGKGKNVDVSDVSKPNVKRLFRKNTSCKTGCLAWMIVSKIDGKGIAVTNSVCSVANGNGKGKVTGDGFSRKGKTIDVFNVSNPDDGFSGKGKNVDVSDVSKPNVKSFRELGFSNQQCMLQVANSNVGPVRAFKLMKEMYGGFENVGATATDCKIFRRDLNLFIRDRDAQMVVEKLENLKKHCDSFFMDYCQGEGDSLCGLFWADKVARLNDQRFGDTISFDATFRLNK